MRKLIYSNLLYLPHIIAGLVAVVIALGSSVAIIFEAARVAGATSAQISSWLLALGVGMGAGSIGLSLYYRMPILIAWSTPGAALLVTSLAGMPMAEIIGAFVFSAALITLSGITGLFEKLIIYIPKSLASAMLAGILLHFGINVFITMQNQFILVFPMFIAYLIGKRIFPRYIILLVLCLGILIARYKGLFNLEHLPIQLSLPVFIMPAFSWQSVISIGVPLFIVTMTSQNIPGAAMLKAAGYNPKLSPIISWTGIINLILAPFGGFAFNLAAITAAICLGKEADPNPVTRYKASVYAGIFYLIIGIFGATIVFLFTALPKEVVLVIAGLAIFNTLG
ncbi:MAG: ydcO, partial [Burkholderiales bacterium]|nr:ydcO [Burkholderiales bacterium]